jgi:hypothetical protein
LHKKEEEDNNTGDEKKKKKKFTTLALPKPKRKMAQVIYVVKSPDA